MYIKLSEVRGMGYGSRMVMQQIIHLQNKGSRGVHLCMSASNTQASSFYSKLGFKIIGAKGEGVEAVIYMGKIIG